MNENWGVARRQLDDVLASERAQRQARRQRTPLWQRLQAWWASRFGQESHYGSHNKPYVSQGLSAPFVTKPMAMIDHERSQR